MFSDNASSIVSEAVDGSFSILLMSGRAKKEEMMERHGIMRRRTLDPPLAAAAAGPACSTASPPRRERVISPAAAVGLGAGEERDACTCSLCAWPPLDFIRPNHMSTQCIYNCSRKVSHITIQAQFCIRCRPSMLQSDFRFTFLLIVSAFLSTRLSTPSA